MKIRVLGCHGSDQLLGARQCRTCGFLVNDTLMVDAGTIGAALRLDEQRRIRHVLLSHLHFDHIQGLPTLADNLVDEAVASVELIGTHQVITGLRQYLFNGHVYPDFMTLPDPQSPIFRTRTFEVGKTFDINGLHVQPVSVNHLVPTVGFLIREGNSSFLYSGDTYETDEIWEVASREPTLKAAFIETSFPDELSTLARVSKHLTPALLARAFEKIKRPDLPVYIYHVKPRFRDDITRQLQQFRFANLTVLEEGQEIVV